MITRLLISFTLLLSLSGCSSLGQKWKDLISDKKSVDPKDVVTRSQGPTYSEQSQMTPGAYRKYKRTTKKDFQDDAHLDSKAGSLWVMEGQGAYLFAQNVVRMIGDPIGIRIEGDPKEQLSQKSQVIADLLKQYEDRRRRALSRQKGEPGEKAQPEEAPADPAAPALANANKVGQQNPAERAPASEKEFAVKTVPTRIVERLVDGNYRVRGTQPFMIGSREYKVIVSGIVRAEDFNDEGIGAAQLLDPNFDIVSSRAAEVR